YDARELDEQTVAGRLDDAPTMFLDFRIEELVPQLLQRGERPLLISPHQARVAGHIGGEDRGETAGLAHNTLCDIGSAISRRRFLQTHCRCRRGSPGPRRAKMV